MSAFSAFQWFRLCDLDAFWALWGVDLIKVVKCGMF